MSPTLPSHKYKMSFASVFHTPVRLDNHEKNLTLSWYGACQPWSSQKLRTLPALFPFFINIYKILGIFNLISSLLLKKLLHGITEWNINSGKFNWIKFLDFWKQRKCQFICTSNSFLLYFWEKLLPISAYFCLTSFRFGVDWGQF